jgi:pyruvyltransferase
MKIYQWGGANIGDAITKPIIDYILNINSVVVKKEETNKLIGIGSVLTWAVRENDIIWGSGLIEDKILNLPRHKVIALRGKLTAKNINSDCEVFGDPGLLLPLLYNPEIEIKHEIGIVEHFIDKGLYVGDGLRINILQNWKTFVDQIKSCKKIISSSLHGIVISEAYGIESEWVKLSDKVIGNGFKFYDYLSGTNRNSFKEKFDVEQIQKNLINVLKHEFNSRNQS